LADRKPKNIKGLAQRVGKDKNKTGKKGQKGPSKNNFGKKFATGGAGKRTGAPRRETGNRSWLVKMNMCPDPKHMGMPAVYNNRSQGDGSGD